MSARLSLLIAALSLIVATVSVGYAVSAGVPGSFRPLGSTRYAVASAQDLVSTNSSSFSNLPNLSQSITIPAGKKGDIFISFCGTGNISVANTHLVVRAMVGSNVAVPPSLAFAQVNLDGDAHCANFYKLNVAQGTKNVRMEWRIGDGAATQQMFARYMLVTVNIHN